VSGICLGFVWNLSGTRPSLAEQGSSSPDTTPSLRSHFGSSPLLHVGASLSGWASDVTQGVT
jgi:hypothetical protein